MSKYYVREDDASYDGVRGPAVLTVRANTAAAQSGADGDFSPLITDTNGKLWVNASGIALGAPADGTYIGDIKFGESLPAGSAAIGSVTIGAGSAAIGKLAANTDGVYIGDIKFGEGLPANSGVDIGDVDVTSVVPGTGATNLGKAEDAAHTSGDVGVMALGVRDDVAASLAANDGDYASLSLDKYGRLRVATPDAADVWKYNLTDNAASPRTSDLGATNMKAAGGSGVRNALTNIYVSYTGVTVGDSVIITVKSGSTVLHTWRTRTAVALLPVTEALSFDTPLFGGDNEALTVEADITVTSGCVIDVTASGYSIPA